MEGVFAKQVDSSGIPFHSPAMQMIRDEMLAAMRRAVPEPKQRSSKWVSTSVPEAKWDDELALYCSADYHVNNACSPVLFYEALQKIPPNALTVEIAPHALMQVKEEGKEEREREEREREKEGENNIEREGGGTRIDPDQKSLLNQHYNYFKAILRRNLNKMCVNVGLMNNKAEDELKAFLQQLGKLYQAGANVMVEKLYPPVYMPVPLDTPMLAPW